jgi:hypothetical protein
MSSYLYSLASDQLTDTDQALRFTVQDIETIYGPVKAAVNYLAPNDRIVKIKRSDTGVDSFQYHRQVYGQYVVPAWLKIKPIHEWLSYGNYLTAEQAMHPLIFDDKGFAVCVPPTQTSARVRLSLPEEKLKERNN